MLVSLRGGKCYAKGYAMKKVLLTVAVIVAVVCGVIFHDSKDNDIVLCYQQDAIVTDVLKQRVTIEREDGNIYTFAGNGYNVGDIVTVVFDSKQTIGDVSDDSVRTAYKHL